MKYTILLLTCLLLCGCTVEKIPDTNQNSLTVNKTKNFLGYLQDEDGNMVLPLNTDCYLTTVRDDLKDEMVDMATSLLFEYHILLDSHKYYKNTDGNRINNLKVLNDSFNNEITVDEKLFNAIYKAIEIAKITKGYFNPTIGKVSDVYEGKFTSFDTTNSDPSSSDLSEALKTEVPYTELDEHIVLNKENNSVTLIPYNDKKFSINLGAFSKGYVSEMMYEELIKYNSSFILNLGSSSIITYNNPDEKITWSIGTKEPDKTDSTLFAFILNNKALSTSGDYEQYYFLEDGTRRHHILNPFTGISENYYREIVLSCNKNGGVIDAFSTALFSIGNIDEAISLIKEVEDYYDITIDYCFVEDGYNLTVNKEFNDQFLIQYNSSNIKEIAIIE